MGVGDKQVGVTRTEAIVLITTEKHIFRPFLAHRETAGVTETVTLKGLCLITEVDAGHNAWIRFVERHLVVERMMLQRRFAIFLLETQAQLGGETAPTLLTRDVDRRRKTCRLFQIRPISHITPVAGWKQAVEFLVIVKASHTELGTSLNLISILERMGVVHLSAETGTVHISGKVPPKVSTCRRIEIAPVVGIATVRPVVAIERDTYLATCRVITMFIPGSGISTIRETIVQRGVYVTKVCPRATVILVVGEIVEERILVPIWIGAHPCRQGCHTVDAPVEVHAGITSPIGHSVIGIILHKTTGVAIGVEQSAGIVDSGGVTRITAVNVEIDIHILVCPHITDPRRH